MCSGNGADLVGIHHLCTRKHISTRRAAKALALAIAQWATRPSSRFKSRRRGVEIATHAENAMEGSASIDLGVPGVRFEVGCSILHPDLFLRAPMIAKHKRVAVASMGFALAVLLVHALLHGPAASAEQVPPGNTKLLRYP